MLDGKIVGGFPVNISQVPWQVGLIYGGQQVCGGSIISNQWILTAAHCIRGVGQPNRYQVLVGATDKFSGGKRYKIASYAVHERYSSSNIDYDFGLLKLQEELEFDSTVKPAALPKADDVHVADGTTVLVSGWGHTQNNSESSRYLRAVEVPTVNQEVCHKAYQVYGGVTDRMFCAGNYKNGGKDG